jgi:hypothetical protein
MVYSQDRAAARGVIQTDGQFFEASSKHQHPSSRKTSNTKPQGGVYIALWNLKFWCFSGAWYLEFGASFRRGAACDFHQIHRPCPSLRITPCCQISSGNQYCSHHEFECGQKSRRTCGKPCCTAAFESACGEVSPSSRCREMLHHSDKRDTFGVRRLQRRSSHAGLIRYSRFFPPWGMGYGSLALARRNNFTAIRQNPRVMQRFSRSADSLVRKFPGREKAHAYEAVRAFGCGIAAR